MACGHTDGGTTLNLLAEEIFFCAGEFILENPLRILPCEYALKGRQLAATVPSHSTLIANANVTNGKNLLTCMNVC